MKLNRKCAGHYYFENENGEIVNIFKIKDNLWGYSIGHSMTKGTFKSLSEVRKMFNI